jgi:hypothetical protein
MKVITQLSPSSYYVYVVGHSFLIGILLSDTWNCVLVGPETEFHTRTKQWAIIILHGLLFMVQITNEKTEDF